MMTTRDDPRQAATALLDEAVHRLRLASPDTLPSYYVGTLPFILALLYFWADQGHDPAARAHGSAAALGLAFLFLWMKIWQAVFAARLGASIRRQASDRWTPARVGRLAVVQIALQPSGLFLLAVALLPAVLHLRGFTAFCLSLLLTVPFGWTYAFYQNVTALGDGTLPSIRAVGARALRHARHRPRQNHLGLSVLSVLALFAWINLLALAFLLPQLARMFTGEENVFTRSGAHLLNTTFFGVTGALVYLALDPLAKTFYVLRCFYQEALRSGEDLKSELAALPAPATGGERGATRALAGALGVLLLAGSPARAAAPSPAPLPPPAAASGSVSAPELGRSIDAVLRRREFAWRSARVPAARQAEAPPPSFFGDLGRWLQGPRATLGRWLRALLRHLRPHRRSQPPEPAATRGFDPAALRALLYVLIAALTVPLGWLTWRHWRRRRRGSVGSVAAAAAPAPAPDLTDDAVLASELPEDAWVQLARDLLAGGDRRLALRAFYLSVLAALGERGLLAIARHKSNHDYLRELSRRAAGQPDLQGAFARNVRRFERVWYGAHPADDALLADFQADRQRVLG